MDPGGAPEGRRRDPRRWRGVGARRLPGGAPEGGPEVPGRGAGGTRRKAGGSSAESIAIMHDIFSILYFDCYVFLEMEAIVKVRISPAILERWELDDTKFLHAGIDV